MSSSNRGADDDGRDLDKEWFIVVFGCWLGVLSGIQLALGINTIIANVVTVLVIMLTIVLIGLIWIRGDTPADWLLAVVVMKPVTLIQQKFRSWGRNWRVRDQNPHRQTPLGTLLSVLHWIKSRFIDLISQIAALISTWVGSDTTTNESTQSDDASSGTTDDDTETTNE